MHRPHLATVVCGNAGTGKSTLGRRLAAEQGATFLDSDTCSERLVRLVMMSHGLDPNDRDSSLYKELLRDPVYETVFDIAHANLAHAPCVIVAPFTRERRWANWPSQLAARLEAPIEVVYVHCSEAERRRRLELRNNPRDAAKLAHWHEYSARTVDDGPPPFAHRSVDTTPSS